MPGIRHDHVNVIVLFSLLLSFWEFIVDDAIVVIGKIRTGYLINTKT